MSIRNVAKAIIINEGKILLNECFDNYEGKFYTLPGGGQNQYETLYETLTRECLEETGYTIIPVRFAALFEEIYIEEYWKERCPDYTHIIHHIFICSITNEKMQNQTEKDSKQIKNEWIELRLLKNVKLLPKTINENIVRIINNNERYFFGSEKIGRRTGRQTYGV